MDWLEKDTVLSYFAHNNLAFDEFMAQGNDKSLDAFYSRKRFTPWLGSDSFVNALLNRLSPQASPTAKAEITPQFPDLPTLAKRIGQYFEVSQESLLAGSPGRRNYPRNMAIYLASRRAGFRHVEIGKFFNISSDSAVSRVCQRMREALVLNPQWQKDLESVLECPKDSADNMCQVRH